MFAVRRSTRLFSLAAASRCLVTRQPASSIPQPSTRHPTKTATENNVICRATTSNLLCRTFTTTPTTIPVESSSLHVISPINPKHTFNVPFSWLRDHCPCPACVHPSTRQKLHSSADILPDLRPKSISLLQGKEGCSRTFEITWSGSGIDRVDPAAAEIALANKENDTDHISLVTEDYLAEFFDKSSGATPFQLHPTPTLWNRKLLQKSADDVERNGALKFSVDYKDYMNSDNLGFLRALRHLGQYGLVFLRNVPTTGEALESVSNRIGPIRSTFYGRQWEVISVPDAKNIAYTALHLNLHMDLLYFEAPPGLQFLHCHKHSVKGGASTFLDSFAVAELLRTHYPEDYEILREVPVTFHYVNDGHHMHYRRPTIVTPISASSTNATAPSSVVKGNDPIIINFAPPFQGQLENCSPIKTAAFYKAFRRFSLIMEGRDRTVFGAEDSTESNPLLYTTTLKPGDLVIFANRRVLHGRTSFDASSGERHLKGSYVDGDDFRDTWRVMEKKVGKMLS